MPLSEPADEDADELIGVFPTLLRAPCALDGGAADVALVDVVVGIISAVAVVAVVVVVWDEDGDEEDWYSGRTMLVFIE